MLNWFRKFAGIEPLPEVDEDQAQPNEITERGGVFSTSYLPRIGGRSKLLDTIEATTFQRSGAMDSVDTTAVKFANRMTSANMTDTQLAFFGSQSFIGYQLMAMLTQNWLINKACMQPAKDAIRKGFEITVNDGLNIPPEVLDFMRECDEGYGLNAELKNFVYFGRVFGIRIVKFEVDSSDPEYYEKPFNPDGITPGSYRGMVQIDPYWITPELSGEAASNPDNRHFYEPTWWRVNGQRIHRSHLVIFKGPEVGDVLKPTYLYGGLSIPQIIFERVYAAERTANEAPMLAQSKRETVIHVDVDKALANQAAFEDKMDTWAHYRNNWGVKIVGKEEIIEQFETSLADLDDVIMTQFQLVASIAGVPVTKLLGTVPKGFNSTGEYDEANYHEELETIQTNDMNRLVARHHVCVIRSDVKRAFPECPIFKPTIVWRPLDALTAEEKATVNKLKAETGTVLMQSGAIDGEDERNRIINDQDSGYSGLAAAEPELDLTDDETVTN